MSRASPSSLHLAREPVFFSGYRQSAHRYPGFSFPHPLQTSHKVTLPLDGWTPITTYGGRWRREPMPQSAIRSFRLPLEDELDLHRLTNPAGMEISVLPNGCVFAIEHVANGERTMISQVFGSPLGSGIGRVLLRLGTGRHEVEIAGAGARVEVGGAADRFVWAGETDGMRHSVTLWLHPRECVWFWRVDLENTGGAATECDVILIQDIGLAARGMVLANEAYTSQYVDHFVGERPADYGGRPAPNGGRPGLQSGSPGLGHVLMSRQNMAQYDRNPWVAHGCLEGSAAFATDASQLFGPGCRATGGCTLAAGADLPSVRLQGEAACAALQSSPVALAPAGTANVCFYGIFEPHHPDATSDADLVRLDAAERASQDYQPAQVPLAAPARSILQDALPLAGDDLTDENIRQKYPARMHEESQGGALLSFFTPDGAHTRHIATAAKERIMRRRHGAILRSGETILPEENGLSVTCWMHGVFAAQLTIGNTALHKLFSVSRDPYNIIRASGLRILADRGDGWRLLTMPSLFEMGLSDCRWIYQFADGAIEVHGWTPADDTAMAWQITASGKPCRFVVLGHAVMGEHDFRHPAIVDVDDKKTRISFRPNPDWIWGEHYPKAVHHLVTATPEAVEALGSGALLFDGDAPRSADAFAAIRTRPVNSFAFALVGDLLNPARAEALAVKYENGPNAATALQRAGAFWSKVTRNTRFSEKDEALSTIFPWFAHNAMVHLSVPRGLEQYSAAAWGTRDVCQGPIELLLPLGHYAPVREILRIVYAQQYERAGDWPQWFMLDPYRGIRDRHSHGDVIVWPLKALCDYLEATSDFAFLDEPIAWTADDFSLTAHSTPLAAHIEKQLAVIRERFIPGTHLIRYGLGDWNDALQPADPAMRDWMVSAWTVALLYQQITRYAALLKAAGQSAQAETLRDLASRMREDYNRLLLPGGTVAGYALFKEGGGAPEPIMHPDDHRTGVRYSLIAMTRAMIAGLFTPEQAQHHMRLIREHLLYPDGARLMDKPVEYRGGLEVSFRRAESAAFFGREIGLMYGHSHLRYCEALDALGDTAAARTAMRVVNPISVTEDLAHASLRQRNAYFSSSDAAFRDRAEANAEWAHVGDGKVAVDGGWRIYSSGPGIFTRLALKFQQGSGAKPVLQS
jgi:cellobiose phosphorylase